MNNLLSVKQVAFILKVHPLTIRRYNVEKKLKAIKDGGNIRITEQEVENFHKDVDAPVVEKTTIKTFKKIPDKHFSLDDPLLRLQGRAASLKLT
ncbi:MAG TPA: helix-turn-helix domain-containing protein [Patescibacteria group bacterium]|nr:helix-turn-helix domain-containing protein [Patescibacteria group bacterium]